MRSRTMLGVGLLAVLGLAGAAAEEEKGLTPGRLSRRLAAQPRGDEATKLADEVRAWFGKENLLRGPAPKVSGLETAWAIEAPGESPAPRVVSLDGSFSLPLVRIGQTDVYAASIPLEEGAGIRWAYEVSGKRVGRPDARRRGGDELEVYPPHPDPLPRADAPKGKLTQQAPWKSKIFEGTTRDWWVYVPAQAKGDTPACVMVF